MQRRHLSRVLALVLLSALAWLGLPARAADEAPDAMIRRLSDEVLERIKSDKLLQSGDVSRFVALVDEKIMPHLDFERMTASAVGAPWSRATPEQQKSLQEAFKILLVRTYAGALAQVGDQSIVVRALRAAPEDKEGVVRTEVRGRGEPTQLDYRLARVPEPGNGWRIYNFNVGGVWLVEIYRSQFAGLISAKGIDGLIDTLKERNQSNAKSR